MERSLATNLEYLGVGAEGLPKANAEILRKKWRCPSGLDVAPWWDVTTPSRRSGSRLMILNPTKTRLGTRLIRVCLRHTASAGEEVVMERLPQNFSAMQNQSNQDQQKFSSPSTPRVNRVGRATRSIASLAIIGMVTSAVACESDFNMKREAPTRGTIGEEVFGVLCDRLGAQALREDLSGVSFAQICHRDEQGKFADKVDDSNLPGAVDGARSVDGKAVSVAAQKEQRARAIGRLEAMARKRADIITALDAIFPKTEVEVRDLSNPNPKQSCGMAKKARKLSEELADMLGRFQALYNDGTIPNSTAALGRLTESFKNSPEGLAALARIDARKGYHPAQVALGVIRPLVAYPNLRDLANTLLSAISEGSTPAAKTGAAVTKASGAGAAYPQFTQLLSVLREELREFKADPTSPVVASVTPDTSGRISLLRPRTTFEALAEVMFAKTETNPGAKAAYVLKRDARGYAEAVFDSGRFEGPFLDGDRDGLADIDDLGQFLTKDNSAAPPPFFVAGLSQGKWDKAFRSLTGQGKLVYNYIDMNKTFVSSMFKDVRVLFSPGQDTIVNALAGAYVMLGARDGEQRSVKVYSDDPTRADDYLLTHPRSKPPADVTKVSLQYNAYRGEESPVVNITHALGQVLGDKSADDLLLLARKLFTENESEVARVVAAMIDAKVKIIDKYPNASIAEGSTFWDDLIDVVVELAKEPGLLEDSMRVLAKDESMAIFKTFADFMSYKDKISYDRSNLNGPVKNFSANSAGGLKTVVDRNRPATGDNRSAMQRMLAGTAETIGVTVCNKPETKIHAKGVPIVGGLNLPLVGTYKECEVFKIEDMAKAYLQSILGKAKLYFRPKIMREGVVGIGASTVKTIELTTGIQGFWDEAEAKTFRPKPQWFNRLASFDVKNDSVQSGPNEQTNLYIRDSMGSLTSAICPSRVIPDPDPDAADASPDKMVRGLRKCAEGDTLDRRAPDSLFLFEAGNFYEGIKPLLVVFSEHKREDMLLKLMAVLHKHWAGKDATESECKLGYDQGNRPINCPRSNLVAFEPMIAELLRSDTLPAVNALLKKVVSTDVAHCTTLDPRTKACKATQNVNAVEILAAVARMMVLPELSKAVGLKNPAGKATALRNDGTVIPQVTPIYLVLEALRSMDRQFDAHAKTNPEDGNREDLWVQARSQLVDQFLGVNLGANGQAAFANRSLAKIAPVAIDMLRSQLAAHCADTFVPPHPRCVWARETLTKDVREVISGPLVAAGLDLVDALRKDEGARNSIQALAAYLLDQTSNNDALAAMYSSFSDVMQLVRDSENLVPLVRWFAGSFKPSLVASDGRVIQKGSVESMLALLNKVAGKAYDGAGDEICSQEFDPNQIIVFVLERLVTPMQDENGIVTQTPLELLLDAIKDINRVNPSPSPTKLSGADYANIASEVSDFLLNKESGLEQLYEIIRQGSVK